MFLARSCRGAPLLIPSFADSVRILDLHPIVLSVHPDQVSSHRVVSLIDLRIFRENELESVRVKLCPSAGRVPKRLFRLLVAAVPFLDSDIICRRERGLFRRTPRVGLNFHGSRACEELSGSRLA